MQRKNNNNNNKKDPNEKPISITNQLLAIFQNGKWEKVKERKTKKIKHANS